MDIDKCIEKVLKCEYLSETEVKKLCFMVKSILIEEPNLQIVQSPVIVCGDLHGQFHDLLELFKTGGYPPESKYIFMVSTIELKYREILLIEVFILLKQLLCYSFLK